MTGEPASDWLHSLGQSFSSLPHFPLAQNEAQCMGRVGSWGAAGQDPCCLSQACLHAEPKCDCSAGTWLLLTLGKGKSCLGKFSVKTLQLSANRSLQICLRLLSGSGLFPLTDAENKRWFESFSVVLLWLRRMRLAEDQWDFFSCINNVLLKTPPKRSPCRQRTGAKLNL